MKTKEEVIEGFLNRHCALLIDANPSAYNAIKSQLAGIWTSGRAYGRMEANGEKAKALGEYDAEAGKQTIDEAYARGKEDGLQTIAKDCEASRESGYGKGLADAWDAARKLANMDQYEASQVLGFEPVLFNDWLNKPVNEVIEKFKAYEENRKSAPTNRDKFIETYGFDGSGCVYCIYDGGCINEDSCGTRHSQRCPKWWNDPYEEVNSGSKDK